jgi:uncharacterized protein (TIGR03066 family)
MGGGSHGLSFGGVGGNVGGGNRPQIGGGGNLAGMGNRPGAGGGGIRDNIFAGGGNRPGAGGAGTRNPILAGGGNRPGAGGSGTLNPNIGGGGVRPGAGGAGERNPIIAGGGNRPGAGGSGERNPIIAGGGVRPGGGGSGTRNPIIAGGGIRPGGGGSGTRWDFAGGGNRGGLRPDIGGGIGNRTNIGNRSNIGQIGNNTFNNINIANNRQYFNNWQHGNWNGNWSRPGWAGGGTQWGGGYWNGWAHGWANGYNRGFWNGGWGGYWHGGYGGYWGRPWYAAPIAWGLGAWALGSVMYNSGYASYSNPYYEDGGDTAAYYDYSQPITVINQQPDAVAETAAVASDPAAAVDPAVTAANVPPPSPEIQEGTAHMDLARDAFKNGDYAGAMRELDVAIKALPRDAALHEFRALVFFAMKDYKQAAATLYAVLSAGPGWDWTTLSGMYASNSTYTDQLRELETYVKANPTAADARFVVAYHYLTCGHTEAARKQYEEVLKLQPNDQLSAQLLKLVGGDPTAPPGADPTPQPPDADDSAATDPAAPADIDATKIVGKWTAKRKDGATFSLNLTQDNKFTWSFEQGGKKQEFGGKYSVDGAVLVLERTDGAQMPGLVTLADNGFNFKLYGGPPDDAGLDFKK